MEESIWGRKAFNWRKAFGGGKHLGRKAFGGGKHLMGGKHLGEERFNWRKAFGGGKI